MIALLKWFILLYFLLNSIISFIHSFLQPINHLNRLIALHLIISGDRVAVATNLVVIAGCTSELGSTLLDSLARKSSIETDIVGTYRSKQKLDSIINPSHQFVDLLQWSATIEEIPSLIHYILHKQKTNNYNRIIFLPMMGICLEGSNKDIMEESLSVNALLPTQCILALQKALQLHFPSTNLLTIAISSGEGELCNLHSSITHQLQEIVMSKDITALDHYCSQTLIEDYNDQLEYAYGDTPCYSISKAVLNAYMRIIASASRDDRQQYKLLTCCPGSFLSSMTTQQDMIAAAAAASDSGSIGISDDDVGLLVDVVTAARHIIDMMQLGEEGVEENERTVKNSLSQHKEKKNKDYYQHGTFYRFSREIPW